MRASQARRLYDNFYSVPTVDGALDYISEVIAVSALNGYQSACIYCCTSDIEDWIKKYILRKYSKLWGEDEFFFKIIVDYLVSDGFDVAVKNEEKEVQDRIISICWD